jgi:hypothetical protein
VIAPRCSAAAERRERLVVAKQPLGVESDDLSGLATKRLFAFPSSGPTGAQSSQCPRATG